MDHQCQKEGCTSGARWVCDVHLPCPEPGGATHTIKVRLSMEVCDAHRDDVRPWLMAYNKEAMAAAVMDQGFHEPDWLSVRVEFVPLAGREIKVVEMCCREGCAKRAEWQIMRRFYEIGGKEPVLSALTNLWVCEEHKVDTTSADFLHGEAREITFDWLQKQGVAIPDLDRTELEFVPAVVMVRPDLN